MPADDPADYFEVGADVLATSLGDDGTLTLQIGDAVSKIVKEDGVALYQPFGYVARPSKADPGSGAAQVFVVNLGTGAVCLGSKDLRRRELYGNLGDGEFCIYADGADGNAQAKIVGKGDGSLTLFTTDDNTKTGNGVYIKISPTGFEFHSPTGALVIDKTGMHYIDQSGATMSIGGVSNPLQPNRVRFSGCCIRLDAPQVMLGPTASNGGSGVFMAPVLAPLASAAIGVPTLIGAGLGAVLGVTSTGVFISA